MMVSTEYFNEYLELLADCSTATKKLIDARIASRYCEPRKPHLLLLLNYQVSHAMGIVVMGKAGHFTGIPVIARSIMECYVNFKLLVDGDHHDVYMAYASIKQSKTQFEKLRLAPESEFTRATIEIHYGNDKSMSDDIDQAKKLMNFMESKLPPEYKDKNGQTMTGIENLFKLAGLENEYDAAYRSLSLYSHGNTAAIAGGLTESGRFEWPMLPMALPLPGVDSSVGLLIEQARMLAKLYRLTDAAPFDALSERRTNLLRRIDIKKT